MAKDMLRQLDYDGPTALSWDDTDMEATLAAWQAAKDRGTDRWTVIGGEKGPIQVTTLGAVDEIFEDSNLRKADKVNFCLLTWAH
jgi:hypothetical protein